MPNRSLDEFVGSADGDASDADDADLDAADAAEGDADATDAAEVDPDAADADEVDGAVDDPGAEEEQAAARVDPAAVEPADVTYSWESEGGTCAACGEAVERRWTGDAGLVCADCKEW